MRDTVRGARVQFPVRAVGRDALGQQFPVIGAQWSSSNPAVATIDEAGVVRTFATGRTEITATVGGATARWTADVVRMRRVTVDPYLATPIPGAVWEIPVVLIAYLPTADGATIDTLKNPDFWYAGAMSLDSAEKRVLTFATQKKMGVEEGSRFRGYRDASARPSLGYRVVEHMIMYELVPPGSRRALDLKGQPRFPNWFQVFADLQLEPLMRSRRIKEIWFADSGLDAGFPSYNPAIHRAEDFRINFESNMSSPVTGDISNSYREPDDLPILSHTYIVYGIAYRRGTAEALHNVGHQLEAMLSYVSTRQTGNDRLFWRDFVGVTAQNEFATGRAGWTHMPPNTTQNYDYANKMLVASDIEDWRPDNAGQKRPVNVDTWGALTYPWPRVQEFEGRVEAQWHTYWWQNFPGLGNRIPYGGSWMTNWWAFVGDWDKAIQSGLGLHESTPSAHVGIDGPYSYVKPRSGGVTPYLERPQRSATWKQR